MDSLIFANIVSAAGAIALFIGYWLVSIKGDEKKGILYSGIGSLIMCFAFVMLDSMAFLALNVVWLGISIKGYFKRDSEAPIAHKTDFNAHLVSAIPLFIGGFFVYIADDVLASWCSILIMIFAYTFFAYGKMERIWYVYYSMLANIIGLYHMYAISNVSSFVQGILGIAISVYSISIILKDELELISKS